MTNNLLPKIVIVVVTVVACYAALQFLDKSPPATVDIDENTMSIEIEGVPLGLDVLKKAHSQVVDSRVFRFDPVAIVRMRPNLDRAQKWEEHPDGKVTLRTNNLGLRSNEPTGEPKGRRILMLGDSHMHGFVNDDECLHELLEAHLEEHYGEEFEVLNAGTGGTGPYEYARTLDTLLYLEPEAVVVMMYTGNDFRDVLNLHDYAKFGKPRTLSGEAADLNREIRETWSHRQGMGQGLHQAMLLKQHPEAEKDAVEATLRQFERIKARCEEEGLPLVTIVLPTKIGVDDYTEDERLPKEKVLEPVKLTFEEYGVTRRMGKSVVDGLVARGITVIDPYETFLAVPEPLYWLRDQHLAVRGHALLADILTPVVVEALDAAR